ncbi:unnamed protein product [Rhizophagus irregularis]|uniref:SH3 domain-containing protein n=1 Tax=Rhizophagus irregularis TaxID=588596 RepID=A0A2N1MRU6_9GLOM|nr:hypothetical protein RhiirC2_811138 [Rhizophagus irregularis]CAB4382818.1 unnamed protein product [Rhizophagus irregularis]CAB5380563.1 unnamed protein product [Rhizophagus irregularis]
MSTNWEDLLWRPIHKAKAKMDYHSQHPMDLHFDAGEIIEVLGIENEDWWNGSIQNTQKLGTFKFGSFPKIFVEVVEAVESSFESKNDYQQKKIINSKPNLPPRKKPLVTSNNNKPSYDDDNNKTDVLNKLLNKIPELTKPKLSSSNNSNSSRENSLKISAMSFDLETYEQFESRPDPVSRCEPVVVAKDFEGFFDASVVDFTIIDEYARETPISETETIGKLSYYLTSVWDHPLYKLRAIFTWVTDNISYDCESFFSGQYRNAANGAKDVLKKRSAVCAGYSELFYELSKAARLDVWKINGNAKGAGYTAGADISGSEYGHAWNGVLYEGEYLLIDSTWGAGHLHNGQFIKSFNPFYFMCSPMKMIYRHLPTDPKHQYLKPIISSEEFLNLPYFRELCFKNGINLTRWSGHIAETSKDKISLEFEHTALEETGYYGANLDWKGQSKLAVVVQRLTHPGPNGGILYRILCNIPSNGDGHLSVYYYPRGGGEGPQLITQKIINHGTGSNYKQFVNTYGIPFIVSIVNPLEASLEHNTKVRFEINVFGEHPTPKLLVFDQSFKKKQFLEIVDRNDKQDYVTFVGDVVLSYKGKWHLGYESKDNYFSYIAEYDVD